MAPITETATETRRQSYEPPKVKMMDEAEMLSAFQVTAGGSVSWWAM